MSKRSDLILAVQRDYANRNADLAAEQAAIFNADTSHLDNKRIKERIEHKVRETDKAVLLRLGHWRGWNIETWLPKSQIEFISDGMEFVMIPVWLAKEKRIPFTINTPVFD